jgi:putative FmdB family regulatory protein
VPTYTYQCYECGFRFEKRRPMAKATDPQPCGDCGKQAERYLTDAERVRGVMQVQATGAPVPQNTGFADYDTHVDRIIGESARAGWSAHEERDRVKREVIRQSGERGDVETYANPDGSFRVMTLKEQKASRLARRINSLAIPTLERQRRRLPSGNDL